MIGHSRGRRARWLRAALVIGVAVAAHALGGSSAQAASISSLSTGPMAAAGGGRAAIGSDTLAGFTSQHFPVFFKVSGDGKMVMVDGIAISMTCTSGNTLVWNDTVGRLPIHPNGKLHASYASPTILTNGTSYSVRDALVARLNPKHSQLTGTWQLAVNFGFSDGTADQCDSGPVAFSATS